MIRYEDIIKNDAVRTYIEKADETLRYIGYTEHSFAHVGLVAHRCRRILETLGFAERTVELACIAAGLHDIGNLINRVEHSQSGAVMAFHLLYEMGMPPNEIADVIAAIGNHDEGTGVPVSDIAAALILADKSDVRRSRVRNDDIASFDIHDRVNYAVTEAELIINEDRTAIDLFVTVDTRFCNVADYFEIFMARMVLCRRAAQKLNLKFGLIINHQRMM